MWEPGSRWISHPVVRHPVREVQRQSIKAQDALIIWLAVAQNQGVIGAIQLLHWQAKKPRVQATIVPLVPPVESPPPPQENVKIIYLCFPYLDSFERKEILSSTRILAE